MTILLRRVLLSACLAGGLTCAKTHADEPYVRWAVTGVRPDLRRALTQFPAAVSPDGHFFTTYFNSQNRSICILHLDGNGTVVETNTLSAVGVVGIGEHALAIGEDGSYYLAGATNGPLNPSQEGFFVTRLNSSMHPVWIGDAGPLNVGISSGKAIALGADGSVYIAGTIRSAASRNEYNPGDHDGVFVAKYGSDGRRLWTERIEHRNSNQWYDAEVGDIAVDSGGHVVIGGWLSSGTTVFGTNALSPGTSGRSFSGDPFIARFNPDGSPGWMQLSYGSSIAADHQGNIYATYQWPKLERSGLAKIAPTGALLWSKDFAPAYPAGVALDSNDEPIFTGEFTAPVTLGAIEFRPKGQTYWFGQWQDFFLAKLNSSGDVQWAMAGGGTELDGAHRVLCDSEGNIFLTGVVRKDPECEFDGFRLPPDTESNRETFFAVKLGPKPRVDLDMVMGDLVLSWPAKATNYVVEVNNEPSSNSWRTIDDVGAQSGATASLRLDKSNPSQFFRLRRRAPQ